MKKLVLYMMTSFFLLSAFYMVKAEESHLEHPFSKETPVGPKKTHTKKHQNLKKMKEQKAYRKDHNPGERHEGSDLDSKKHQHKGESTHRERGEKLNHGVEEEEHDHQHKEEHKVDEDHDHEEHKENHSEEEHQNEEEGDSHHHGEHEGGNFGPDKAITKVRYDGRNFKLSKEAEQVMGLSFSKFIEAHQKHQYLIPKKSLVEYQEKTGVFIKREGWYELIQVKVLLSHLKTYQVYSKQIQKTDQLVVTGLGLLRVAHLEASGQGGQGHAH